jgi:replication-associated recombination protein RarA
MGMIVHKVGNRRPDWNASTTPDGKYSLAEVLSAVIKEIRRGNVDKACFWSYQMHHAGDCAAEFLWEALAMTSIEDIGLAEPNAINVVMNTKKFYDSMPTGYVGRDLAVTFVTTFLAKCPKSRLTDEILYDMMQRLEAEGPWEEIPDYALDHHTKRGREMGRDEKFFFEEASKLVGETKELNDSSHRNAIMKRLK